MQYAIENGCPWDEEIYLGAAKYGNLNILQYVHELIVLGFWLRR